MLNPVHLETLLAVLRTGSLSAAGKELGYTTSAVSQHVKSLERALRITLFERGPSTLTPTHAARQLEVTAQSVLASLHRVEHDLQLVFSGERGRLRIAAFPSVAARVLPRAISRLTTAVPGAEFVVTENSGPRTAVADVLAAHVDVAFVYEHDVLPMTWPSELTVHSILDEELVMLSGEGSSDLPDRLSLADLHSQVWVTGKPGTAEHTALTHWCAQSGFAPDIRLHSNDFEVIRGFVREGLGLALAPVLAFGTDRSIRMHRFDDCRPRRTVRAIYRAADTNPLLPRAMRAVDHAVDEFRTWTTTAFAINTTDDPLVAASSAPDEGVGRVLQQRRDVGQEP